MPRKGSESLTLPTPLLDEVREYIKDEPRWANPTEFCKEAIRLRLEQLQAREVKVRA